MTNLDDPTNLAELHAAWAGALSGTTVDDHEVSSEGVRIACQLAEQSVLLCAAAGPTACRPDTAIPTASAACGSHGPDCPHREGQDLEEHGHHTRHALPLAHPPAVAFARHVIAHPISLRNDINHAARALSGKPVEACALLSDPLDMAVLADRMTENALDGDPNIESLHDLIATADATGLLQDGHRLQYIDAALAVAAQRNHLLVDVWLLGDVEKPYRLLRAFACILRIRLMALAQSLGTSGSGGLGAHVLRRALPVGL